MCDDQKQNRAQKFKLWYNIYSIKEVITQTQRHLLFPQLNKQAVLREHCFRRERWQGPPHVNRVKQADSVSSFKREFVYSVKIFLFWLKSHLRAPSGDTRGTEACLCERRRLGAAAPLTKRVWIQVSNEVKVINQPLMSLYEGDGWLSCTSAVCVCVCVCVTGQQHSAENCSGTEIKNEE